jgi:hypothetical protein
MKNGNVNRTIIALAALISFAICPLFLVAETAGMDYKLLSGLGKKKVVTDISANGDCQRKSVIQFNLRDYSRLKKALPNSYYFLQRYGSLQADFEIDNHQSAYVDSSSSVELNFRMLGFSQTIGRAFWAVPIESNQEFIAKGRDDETGRITFHFTTHHEKYRFINLTVQSKYILPKDAIDAKWNEAKKQVEYKLDKQYPAEGGYLELLNFYAKDRIVTASYKTYGLGKGNNMFSAAQWIGKAVFKNEGKGILKGLKVRFKTSGYAEWSPWQTTKEIFPDQTVVITYYPVLQKQIGNLQADAPSDIICQYELDGKTNDESQRVKLLSKNSFVFSYLLAGERFGTWHEDHASAPFLSAWVSRNDPVINMFSPRANRAAGGIGAKANDNAAVQVLEKCYQLLVANDITYQHPHNLEDKSVSYDPRSIQNIKYPRDVLRDHSGTCVDLAILYASMANALGLKPYLVLTAGHCFPVIKLPSGTLLPVETTMLKGGLRFGVGTFAAACRIAKENMAKAREGGKYVDVDVQQWWQSGISNPELERLPEDILQKWKLFPILKRLDPASVQQVVAKNQDNISIATAVPAQAERIDSVQLVQRNTIADIRAATITRAQRKGWTLVNQTESMIQLQIKKGKVDATVYITFSPREAVIYSDSYVTGRAGRVPSHPRRWIRYLKADIAAAAAQ